ncbi:hydrogenase expression/formation protein HypE [Candidatus Latescibacterota bacterium]
MSEKIRLAHGFGGKLMQDLLDKIIHPAISGNDNHIATFDAAVLKNLEPPVVVSTDSFTVSPRFFPGGDIGKLSVIGTVNDLAMMGAKPAFLTLGLIIEEGLEIEEFRVIVESIGTMCRQTDTKIVTGDTKVVEKGVIDGIFINTTGLGTQVYRDIGPQFIREGDVIIISGTVGDHGVAILNARENLGFSKALLSDCAPLNELVAKAAEAVGKDLHALRDPTRGGLAATINEFAIDTGLQYVIEEDKLPVRQEVGSFIELLGLDLLTQANEGKALIIVAPESVDATLTALHEDQNGKDAAVIGHVERASGRGRVILETSIGTRRIIDMPLEAGLPRIC